MRFPLILLFTYWIGGTTFAQNIALTISADKTILEEGFPISIKIESNQPGQISFDFPKSFQKTNTSNGATQNISGGKRQIVYYFTQHGFFKTAGTYKIRAVLLVKGKKYKSNKIRVKVVKKTPSRRIDSKKEYASLSKIHL